MIIFGWEKETKFQFLDNINKIYSTVRYSLCQLPKII